VEPDFAVYALAGREEGHRYLSKHFGGSPDTNRPVVGSPRHIALLSSNIFVTFMVIAGRNNKPIY
jgi:hypothetical protein